MEACIVTCVVLEWKPVEREARPATGYPAQEGIGGSTFALTPPGPTRQKGR